MDFHRSKYNTIQRKHLNLLQSQPEFRHFRIQEGITGKIAPIATIVLLFPVMLMN
jgi:hypothetical protein